MKNTHGFTEAQTLPHHTDGGWRVGPESDLSQPDKDVDIKPSSGPAPASVPSSFSSGFLQLRGLPAELWFSTGSAGWKPTLEAPTGAETNRASSCSRAPLSDVSALPVC